MFLIISLQFLVFEKMLFHCCKPQSQHFASTFNIVLSADQLDVLLFQNFLLRKQSGPSSIPEGSQSLYSVVLDGPPPTNVALELEAADNFARFESTQTPTTLLAPDNFINHERQ